MSLTASISYEPQLDPTTFNIVDTTPYAGGDTHANFSARTLTILQSDNTALPGYTNPIPFQFSGGEVLPITGLTGDVAITIVMTLTPITPVTGSIYTAEADVATNRFLQQGLYNIQVARLTDTNPSYKSDKVYRYQSIDLLIEMSNSQIAMLYSNYTGAQSAINRGEQIILNATL